MKTVLTTVGLLLALTAATFAQTENNRPPAENICNDRQRSKQKTEELGLQIKPGLQNQAEQTRCLFRL